MVQVLTRPSNWRSWLLLMPAVVASGLLHGASWVHPSWMLCAWLGQAMLVAIAVTCRPRSAFFAGLGVGCIGLSWAFAWAPDALALSLQTSWTGSRAIYGGLVLWESVEIGVFCLLSAILVRRSSSGMLGVPIVWAVVEYWWPKIFPWMLGHTQLEFLPILQVAELTGPIGIGFVVTTVAAVPASFLVWKTQSPGSSLPRWLVVFNSVALVLFAIVLGFGYWRLDQLRSLVKSQPKLRIAMVQVDTAYQGSVAKLQQLTAAIQEPVDLICWPESAIGDYDSRLMDFADPERTRQFSRNSWDSLRPIEGNRSPLLVGGRTYHPDAAEEGPYFQTAFLIDARQQILGRYHKRTLLPFGEYVPGQDYYPEIRQWATLGEVIGAGTESSPLRLPNGTRLGVVICYEDLLPDNMRETARAGADILVSLINATAFEVPLTLRQHERIARLRAVENRRYFVRCSSTGISCIVAPTGEVVAQLEAGLEGTCLYDVPIVTGATVYSICGNYFPWICTAALLLWTWKTRRSARPPDGNGWQTAD